MSRFPNPVLKEVLGDDIPVLSLMPPCYSVIKKMDAYVYFFSLFRPFYRCSWSLPSLNLQIGVVSDVIIVQWGSVN